MSATNEVSAAINLLGNSGWYQSGHMHAESLMNELSRLQSSLAENDETIAGLRSVLTELVAMVRGECASLLDEDRGGNSRLSLAIDAAIAAQHAAQRKEEGK